MLPVLAATVAAFVIGGVYYATFGSRLGEQGEMPPWKFAAEVLRCLVLAAVVAILASQADVDELAAGLLLGFVLWVGFPLVLLFGAVIHEGVRVTVATIHAGDWLAKLLVVTAIVSVWQ
jgi:uncharacterized membrane protein YoaK (UPF0700 family)